MNVSVHAALKVTNKHEVERVIKEKVTSVFDHANKDWCLKDTLDGISVFTDQSQVSIGQPSNFVHVTQVAKVSRLAWQS